MKKTNLESKNIVKLTYTNPIGMQVTVTKKMTDSEIKETTKEGKAYITKIIA